MDDNNNVVSYSITDARTNNDLDAILSMFRTVFVSIVLSSGAVLFTRDVDTLILTPIENMMKKVRRIADNPLEAA